MSKLKERKDRFSLDFPEGAKERFEKLRLKSSAGTISELFRRAISVYEFLLDCQNQGYKITIEHPEKEKEVVRIV